MSAVLPAPLIVNSAWRRALPAMLGVLVLLLVMYRDTFGAMTAIWSRSDTFAHAFLVPPISAWLIWRQRDALSRLVPRPQPLWLLPLAMLAFGWLLADMAGVNSASQLMVTALLVTSVPAVLGWAVARAILFPLGFLFFMVPIGEFLLPLMMEWTADFTVAALLLSGIPVYREGFQFVIPSGNWSVVEACSGVRYLIASFMVGTLFAYLNYRSLRRRLLFCAFALAVPIVANWLRAYMIVMLGHLSGNQLAVGADHLVYGWVFFGVVITVMFAVGSRWAEADWPAAAPASASSAGAGLGQAPPALAPLWPATLAALVLALPHVANWQWARQTPPGPVALSMPELRGVSSNGDAPALLPSFKGAAAEAVRSYAAADGVVGVHLAYYRQQRYGAKLVSSDNLLLRSDDRVWVRSRQFNRPTLADGAELDFTVTEIRRSGAGSADARERLEVRQIYWIDGRWTSNNQAAVALSVLSRLRGRGDDAASVTLISAGDSAATQRRLDAFGRDHLAAIGQALAAARAQR